MPPPASSSMPKSKKFQIQEEEKFTSGLDFNFDLQPSPFKGVMTRARRSSIYGGKINNVAPPKPARKSKLALIEESVPKRTPGRPRKVKVEEEEKVTVKKTPGRPRKTAK